MKYKFSDWEVRNEIIAWIQQYAQENGMKKVAIGISGGKDSAVCAALCCRAIGKENVYGLLMPNGVQSDIQDSIDICNALGIEYYNFNISGIDDAVCQMFVPTISLTKEAYINIAPRIRMLTLYAFAQSMGCRVCGTGNLSEATLGYFTKWGDGAHDFNPIANLTSVEVVQVGLTMHEIPSRFVNKTPTDGLCGLSDEERLGMSYEFIHNVIRNLTTYDGMGGTVEQFRSFSTKAYHKLNPIPSFPFDPNPIKGL